MYRVELGRPTPPITQGPSIMPVEPLHHPVDEGPPLLQRLLVAGGTKVFVLVEKGPDPLPENPYTLVAPHHGIHTHIQPCLHKMKVLLHGVTASTTTRSCHLSRSLGLLIFCHMRLCPKDAFLGWRHNIGPRNPIIVTT